MCFFATYLFIGILKSGFRFFSCIEGCWVSIFIFNPALVNFFHNEIILLRSDNLISTQTSLDFYQNPSHTSDCPFIIIKLLISISNVSTFKLQDKYLFPQLKLSLQGNSTRGYLKRFKSIRRSVSA